MLLSNRGRGGIYGDERGYESAIKVLKMNKNSTVLVVDDEPGVRQSFKMVLDEHCRLHFAEDGKTALEIFKQKHIDLVLLDILLPDLDGLDLLKQLKAIEPDTIPTASPETGLKQTYQYCGGWYAGENQPLRFRSILLPFPDWCILFTPYGTNARVSAKETP